MCINDLLGNTEKFKNVNTWCKVFNKVDYLRWYGIIQAIPATWRAQITTKIRITEIDHGPGFKTDGDLMLLEKASSKLLYKYFVSQSNTTPSMPVHNG